MGTLTAGQPRLAHYCEHKLPTSCRLSSLAGCCACEDERAHAASYSTYIDGVGFVLQGTRWQRYCWFCKEFWENRVRASGLRPGQTRVPEFPDQTEFLQRWYEFHQGYRIVRHEDGAEEQIAVLGEDFRDVSPGCLPRTLEELRAGRDRGDIEEQERLTQHDADRDQTLEAGPSLEDTLDQMFQAASVEEVPATRAVPQSTNQFNVHAQSIVPIGSRNHEYQTRRIAALRRELHRMRNGIERVISGLRDLGENVPDHTEASSRLSDLGRTLDTISGSPPQEVAQSATNNVNALGTNSAITSSDRTIASMQERVEGARQQVEDARRNRDQAASELDVAEQEFRTSQSRLRQLQNELRTAENYIRLFGTREEMLAQGDAYESPIGGMFTRAWERFRDAEEVRREERTLRRVLQDEEFSGDHGLEDRLSELSLRERDVWGVPQSVSSELPRVSTSRQPAIPRFAMPSAGSLLEEREEHNFVPQATMSLTDHDSAEEGLDALSDQADSDAGFSPEMPATNHRGEEAAISAVERGMDARTREHSQSTPRDAQPSIVAGPPGQQLDDDPYVNNDRGQDALFVLTAGSSNVQLRGTVQWARDESITNRLIRSVTENSLGWADREILQDMLGDEDIVWVSRLPAERNRRRRQRGENVSFTPDAFEMARAGQTTIHDIEVMAEAFQMSSSVRRLSDLASTEQLRMLYRLQRGDRRSDDRNVLARMLLNDYALSIAASTVEEALTPAHSDHQASLERQRRDAARQGDHSRTELDAARRATRTALAASRAAMDAGPSALLQRMADRDEETRAAYQRMQDNGFAPADTMTSRRLRNTFYRPLRLGDLVASTSGSDSEGEGEDQARGLDAKDSGRPEQPLSEEEMTILLDCRVCYSQKAEICTLPCGHLTMCKWCSDQHSPTMAHDQTRPRRAANCPVCRKQIRQKVRVIRA